MNRRIHSHRSSAYWLRKSKSLAFESTSSLADMLQGLPPPRRATLAFRLKIGFRIHADNPPGTDASFHTLNSVSVSVASLCSLKCQNQN